MSVPHSDLAVEPRGEASNREATPDPAATRRCGRCLQQFPADPDAEPVVMQELWMCPPCRRKLL